MQIKIKDVLQNTFLTEKNQQIFGNPTNSMAKQQKERKNCIP